MGSVARQTMRVSRKAKQASPLWFAMLLFAVHGLNDHYNSYLGALMPVLMDRFGMTLALAGGLSAVANLSTSFFQPIFGYFLDRSCVTPSLFVWPIITAVATCAIGFAPSVALVVPLLVIAGLSTAAFHPHASSIVPKTQTAGLAMSLFVAGGTFGVSIGPVASLWVVNRYGLPALWVLAVPAVVISFLAMRVVPGQRKPRSEVDKVSFDLDRTKLRVLSAILGVVILRSTVGIAYTTFLSVHLKETGFPLVKIGFALLVHTMAGAVGSIVGGAFSDRFGRKTTITAGLLGILPAYVTLVLSSGALTWVALMVGGFMMSSFNPVTVVMAQDLFPRNRGTAAGIVMGFGWSFGGLVVSFIGALADRFGLVKTLALSNLLLIPAILISLSLPGRFFRSDHSPAQTTMN